MMMKMCSLWVVVLCAVVGASGRPQNAGPPLEALGPMDYLPPMEPVHVQPRDINVINEPTCDELKAMWRFSKRQARAPEIMNEITTYKDPFSYNEWSPYYGSTSAGYVSSSRSAGGGSSGGTRFRTGSSRRPVFGRVVHKAPLSAAIGFNPHGARGYDQGEGASRRPSVLRLPGGGVPAQTGRFQHLKELIRTERARELQQQRAAEELAARAAALKEIAGGQRFREDYHGHKHREYVRAPLGAPQDEYNMADDPTYYHTTRYSGDNSQRHGSSDSIITYPNVLAPPTRRSSALLFGGKHSQPEYLLPPLLANEDYFNPFAFNMNTDLIKNLIDDHAIQRSDNSHGIMFN